MSARSFKTQCPRCKVYGTHTCSTKEKHFANLSKLYWWFRIEDIVINQEYHNQIKLKYSKHERECSYCEYHFKSGEIADEFLQVLFSKIETLKNVNNENEILKEKNRELNDKNKKLENKLEETKTELAKKNEIIKDVRYRIDMSA